MYCLWCFFKTPLLHLTQFGINLNKITLQTDNGTEFVNPPRSKRKSMFELTVESFGPTHRLIPPAAPTFNSDVEAFHRIVEDEFYAAERVRTPEEFYGKAICYQAYFNLLRKNRNKNNRTPFDILQEHFSNPSPWLMTLPPIDISPLVKHIIPGYHVRKAVRNLS